VTLKTIFAFLRTSKCVERLNRPPLVRFSNLFGSTVIHVHYVLEQSIKSSFRATAAPYLTKPGFVSVDPLGMPVLRLFPGTFSVKVTIPGCEDGHWKTFWNDWHWSQ
jgi:hypothetical protein